MRLYVAPLGGDRDQLVAGTIAVGGMAQLIDRDRRSDRRRRRARLGVWGTLATGLFAAALASNPAATRSGGLVTTERPHQPGVQALGILAVGAFTFTASFGALWTMKRIAGIRVDAAVEQAGLDVSEHGMWGYPRFCIWCPACGSWCTPLRFPRHAAPRDRSRGDRGRGGRLISGLVGARACRD